jgi:hypothetical protein
LKKHLTNAERCGIIKVQKRWRYSKMYVVLVGSKSKSFNDLEWAKEVAKKDSLVNFRASVFEGNEVIAKYEWGKELFALK